MAERRQLQPDRQGRLIIEDTLKAAEGKSRTPLQVELPLWTALHAVRVENIGGVFDLESVVIEQQSCGASRDGAGRPPPFRHG